jgi:hypothetical protein
MPSFGFGTMGVDGLDGEGIAFFVASVGHRCYFDQGVKGDLAGSARSWADEGLTYFDVG